MPKTTITSINIILSVIILILVSAVAYLIIQPSIEQLASTPGISPIVSTPTADWKTYRNEKYGFEVKYPKGWYKKESTMREYTDVKFVATEAELGYSITSPNISITIYPGFTQQNLEDWFYKKSHPSEPTAPGPPTFEKNLTVAGRPAIQATQEAPGTAGIVLVYLVNGNAKYEFELQLPDVEEQKIVTVSKEIFNQILSTFEFTK